MNIGRAVNGPKMSILDHLLCLIGLHSYHSVYYDSKTDAAYDVCICGHCRKFGEEKPLIFRTTKSDPKFKTWYIGL